LGGYLEDLTQNLNSAGLPGLKFSLAVHLREGGFTTHYILYTTYYKLHTTYYKLHTTYYILHTGLGQRGRRPAGGGQLGTLHLTPYTLYPTPYTLHPTLYDVHPTPYPRTHRRSSATPPHHPKSKDLGLAGARGGVMGSG